jgi:apolipoprotein N-acyltransferase
MSILSTILATVFSAVILALGIPNEFLKAGSALLGLVSLVPLYLALKSSKSYTQAGFLGGLMMMVVHLISSFWLAYFKEFAIFTLGGSALVCFCIGILAGWLLRYTLTFPAHVRPFLFAAVWTCWEWFKSSGFFGYPWGTIIMTSRELTHLIQIADITGSWGISFIMALVSAVFAEIVIQTPALSRHKESFFPYFKSTVAYKSAIFTVFILLLCMIYGQIRIMTQPKSETTLDVVIVQQNMDPWEEDGIKRSILTSEALTRQAIAESGKKPDLVVWSESVLSYPYLENKDYYERITNSDPLPSFLAEINVPLLVGSPVVVDPKDDSMANAVVLIGPKGQQLDWHGKVQLVPFAEYMPFTEYAAVRNFFDALVGFSRGWVPGTSVSPMHVTNKDGTTVHFATPICFEDAFSALNAKMHNAGSNLLINLTNDAWSETDSAELQHFVIASFRSIELRTTLVRSTNGGYSVVVGPTGTIIDDLPLFTPTAKMVSIPVYPHETTFYARFGDWFPVFLSIIVLLAGFIPFLIDRIRRLR